jgi:hypothetical protein
VGSVDGLYCAASGVSASACYGSGSGGVFTSTSSVEAVAVGTVDGVSLGFVDMLSVGLGYWDWKMSASCCKAASLLSASGDKAEAVIRCCRAWIKS